jgi:hypothetical protein
VPTNSDEIHLAHSRDSYNRFKTEINLHRVILGTLILYLTKKPFISTDYIDIYPQSLREDLKKGLLTSMRLSAGTKN